MTKLMYAVWGDDLPTALRDPDLHARLAEAGAARLQVNLDDEAVAAAMRIPTFDEPIGAIVSVWADGDTQPVTDVLATVTSRLAGYEVEERLPIPPPDVADGERMDTLANVAVLRRPAELTVDEWRHNWLVDHTPVAIATQGTFGYVQNVVVRPVTEDAPAIDALVEELFPSAAMTDMHAFYGSGGDDDELNDRFTRLMTSVARFGADRDLDLVPSSRYVYTLGGRTG
ncbi:EthD domain-containing protein [Nocardioides sp.]|uniref:EthD domain-containing protein n=1 Tax=Nocardioides sp. TaxID=35761 RepID=UPI0025DF344D|nr:EthD domain-containing protein [Nocardioides sp.]